MTDGAQRTGCVTVADFLKAGEHRLALELVAGAAGLPHRVEEAAMNRPGLALTGFFKYFAHRRIQILGHAEMAYLHALAEAERRQRLRRVFARRIPCIVVTRHLRVLPELAALGESAGIPVLRSPLITKHFINAATLLMEEMMAPRVTIQGTMVEIMGIGVLLEGKPGVGKSETALALIKRGHSLVADDVTACRRDSAGGVIGAPVGVTRYHMEIRGLGIIHVPSLFGVASVRAEKRLDLVITLTRADAQAGDDRGGSAFSARQILGVAVPRVEVPVAAGRDLANLVEVAALDFKLKRLGHDAAKELDEKLIAVLTGHGDASE